MWNDRDCSTGNFFICERPLIDGGFFDFSSNSFVSDFLRFSFFRLSITIINLEPARSFEKDDCNKTIYLSQDKTRTTLSSPGFPRFYSDNLNCVSLVLAPAGYRILIEFEELSIEHEPQCSYDYLEMFEPTSSDLQSKNGTARHNHGKRVKKNQLLDTSKSYPSVHQIELKKFMKKSQPKMILQPSNATYNIFAPPPGKSDHMPRKVCGDWSSKLKLLRHRTASNLLGVRFSSDYSHHTSGFKAKVSLEKGWQSF